MKPNGLTLYEENGVEITTHSMLKVFAQCPKRAQYKYWERLKRRQVSNRDKPLRRGTWLHALLEEHYSGRDWKVKHKELSAKYAQLFDEEKESLGDLPRECALLMRSYLWHYGADKSDPLHGWSVLAVEETLECPWPDVTDGSRIYRGRIDLRVEDDYGMYIVDHKSHTTLPDMTFRLLDFASALYIWAAWENGYPVKGFIWNYIRTKVPSSPKMAYVGKKNEGLSVAALDTDYPTYYRGIKALMESGYKVSLDDPQVKRKLRELKSHRWEYGKVQSSPFFRRDLLEKDSAMIARVVASAMRTRDRMHSYDWTDLSTVERSPDRSCSWCDFRELCPTELFDGNAQILRRQLYRVGDPMDYYRDDKELPGSD